GDESSIQLRAGQVGVIPRQGCLVARCLVLPDGGRQEGRGGGWFALNQSQASEFVQSLTISHVVGLGGWTKVSGIDSCQYLNGAVILFRGLRDFALRLEDCGMYEIRLSHPDGH